MDRVSPTQLKQEFAVARQDGRLEGPRSDTHEGADGIVDYFRDLKERYRQDCEEWELDKPAEGFHPSGTNEPWWRWHKQGWKDAEWRVVVRDVTEWRDA